MTDGPKLRIVSVIEGAETLSDGARTRLVRSVIDLAGSALVSM